MTKFFFKKRFKNEVVLDKDIFILFNFLTLFSAFFILNFFTSE
uniref:ATPase subunit 8 n=1 Tax=Coscinodiscus granii TaxID=265552 RepID=A0A8A6W357_9STRA|nr:ATPase subunit 8 [Coscinodiscus granii]QTK21663.1 ATPase subunit 8 [Coscinodiscus granii]